MRYENEKCPLCGEIFKEDDEVVVCPECATPHHRECYLKNESCANEHLHNEDFLWKKTEKEEKEPEVKAEPEKATDEETITCPECGTKNKKNAFVCSNCGTVVNPQIRQQFQSPKTDTVFIEGKPVNDNDFIDEEATVTVKEAACFIQGRKESYIKTFLDAKINHRKPKFNISAFLLGPYWFFFRKIYKAGFAFAGIVFAINCFIMTFYVETCGAALSFMLQNADAFMQRPVDEALYAEYIELLVKGIESHPTEISIMFVLCLLVVVVNLIAGIYANKLYLSHIKTTISKIKTVVPNAGAYYTYLYAKGGTTFLNVFLIGMAIYYLSQMVFSQALM